MKNRIACGLTVLAVTACMWSGTAQAGLLENWHWRNPLPQGNSLHNVVFVNGRYIALGELGTLLTSTDGTNWVRQMSGTTSALRDCAYGAGIYVAVGDFGAVLTSTDATNWVPQYAGTFYSLNGITYGGGQFVAVGEQSVILTSPNGSVWTPRSSGPWELRDIIHAGGVFVAVGGDEATANTVAVRVLLTSPDGSGWKYRILESASPLVSLVSGDGTLAAVSSSENSGHTLVWTSNNGLDWLLEASLPPIIDDPRITFGNGKWIIASGDLYLPKILASDDLQTWVTVLSNAPGYRALTGVAFGGEAFVAVRSDGTSLTSSNGLSWSPPWPEPVETGWRSLTYLNGMFWGLGFNQFAFSANGTHWTNALPPTNTDNLLSITYGNGRYVAGGEYRTVWTSTDGSSWTNPAPDLSTTSANGLLVAYGNGVFVGVSFYTEEALTSQDGLTWAVQPIQTNGAQNIYLSGITFGNGRFVAVSYNGTATSVDGTNWFVNYTNKSIERVTSGNGIFVGVGYNTVAISSDGTNWLVQNSAAFGSLRDVAFGSGVFVATTEDYAWYGIPKDTPIWVSTDGIHWSQRSANTSGPLGPVAFGNGTFVMGAKNSGILQSDPLVSLGLNLQSHPQLLLSGPLNRSYRIESTDILAETNSWTLLATVTATNEPTEFTDLTSTNGTKRFYRAVLLP